MPQRVNQTVHGRQLSVLKWFARVATKPIVADGGIRHHGDIAKSVRFGAAMDMVGFLFAGHEESPSTTGEVDGRRYEEYYGSASDLTTRASTNISKAKVFSSPSMAR